MWVVDFRKVCEKLSCCASPFLRYPRTTLGVGGLRPLHVVDLTPACTRAGPAVERCVTALLAAALPDSIEVYD